MAALFPLLTSWYLFPGVNLGKTPPLANLKSIVMLLTGMAMLTLELYVVRNTNGSLILAATFKHSCLDPLAAEALSILDACKLISSLKIGNAIVESDCLDAISLIKGSFPNSFWTADPIVELILKFWKIWPSWNFLFCTRSANGSAHALAKWASVCNCIFEGIVPFNCIPNSIFCGKDFPIVSQF
ncbi:hypothetical protein CASFOL_027918 [Castilleja foliolosa]|uniref:RNase H type-1 domain-containing protein n=1 Tax=Castilleja foliolosa TaxID=1961234 RepID=A0ABD3CH40_9LAMI